jgi:hypothetical protein
MVSKGEETNPESFSGVGTKQRNLTGLVASATDESMHLSPVLF